MFLFTFVVSYVIMFVAPSIMSTIRGFLNTSYFLSSTSTSARNVLILKVFLASSHSVCM